MRKALFSHYNKLHNNLPRLQNDQRNQLAQYEKRTIARLNDVRPMPSKPVVLSLSHALSVILCASTLRVFGCRFIRYDPCWTLSQALAWLPLCAADFVMVVDTLDNSTVAQRRHN
jgi:hypothetical protein